MSFLVAFARRDLALLASDTRTTMRAAPDAPALAFDDDGVKLAPWRSGWLASGPSPAWRDAVVDGRDPADAMRDLEATDPELARAVRERQLTLVVGVDARGCCFQRVVDWRGRVCFAEAAVVALAPADADPAPLQRLLHSYRRVVARASRAELLAATATLYAAVYAQCGPRGTVSPLLSIGLVDATGRELLGPVPHGAWLQEVGAHA